VKISYIELFIKKKKLEKIGEKIINKKKKEKKIKRGKKKEYYFFY
jgi:hypothetical protein